MPYKKNLGIGPGFMGTIDDWVTIGISEASGGAVPKRAGRETGPLAQTSIIRQSHSPHLLESLKKCFPQLRMFSIPCTF